MARDPRRKGSGAPLECRRDVQTALIGTVFCLSAIPNPTIAILIQIIAQAASTCYKKNITKTCERKKVSYGEGEYMSMQEGSASFDVDLGTLACAAAGTSVFDLRIRSCAC